MKKKKPPIPKPKDELCPPPSDFSTAITRIAVAQICQSVGFRAAQRSALETLTDVAARYLRSLAKSAAASAASTGRTQSNLLDIVCALEELHSALGFRGASNVALSLFSSSTLAETMKFVNYSLEIPFAKPVPRRESASGVPTLGGGGFEFVNGRGNHIPKWLPAIPEMRKKEEGSGEEKWGGIAGSSTAEEVCLGGEIKMAERDGKKRRELELPTKRERVSFKLGLGMGKVKGMNEGGIKGMEMVRSGICRGGKRILCQTLSIGGQEEGGNKEHKLQEATAMELD